MVTLLERVKVGVQVRQEGCTPTICSADTASTQSFTLTLPMASGYPSVRSSGDTTDAADAAPAGSFSSGHGGWQLSDLHLRNTVGTGTFGRVRLVQAKSSPYSPPMALKVMKKQKIIQLRQVDHVKAEVKLLSMIQHPFIVSLVSVWQDPNRIFMLMEFVNGGELFSVIRKLRYLPEDHAKLYTAEVALAFEYIHSLQIAYRDLKPENTLLDRQGHLKITDFGFAKVVENRTWTLCGTPEYLAPEIIQMKGHGIAVDWWALGILIFEMLSGKAPFNGSTPVGIYAKVLGGVISWPEHFSSRAKDLIKRLLKDKSSRLGCLSDGAAGVKEHKWFRGLDFEEVLHRRVTPPYVPNVKSPVDTSQFDKYSESDDADTPALSPAEQALFRLDVAPRRGRRHSSIISV